MADSVEEQLRIVFDEGPGGAVVVGLSGEIDIATAASAREALDEAARSGRDVLVDLREVTFMGAAGLGALVHARDALDRDGHRLTLCSPSALIARVLDVSGLAEAFIVSSDAPGAG